jgi:hypothetical protein
MAASDEFEVAHDRRSTDPRNSCRGSRRGMIAASSSGYWRPAFAASFWDSAASGAPRGRPPMGLHSQNQGRPTRSSPQKVCACGGAQRMALPASYGAMAPLPRGEPAGAPFAGLAAAVGCADEPGCPALPALRCHRLAADLQGRAWPSRGCEEAAAGVSLLGEGACVTGRASSLACRSRAKTRRRGAREAADIAASAPADFGLVV